jgi:hypothetical protein
MAALVAIALAMFPLSGLTPASATIPSSATADEGPVGEIPQTAGKSEAIHRPGHLARARSTLNVGSAGPAASLAMAHDDRASLVPPHEIAAIWHSWTLLDAALGRAPPA